jgi:hypothetical protein
MRQGHPYKQYQGTLLWNLVEKAIQDLVDNSDLVEQTSRAYIVGHICKVIEDENKRTQDEKGP